MSVITPTLDRRDQLEGAIHCVRTQTYPEIEHIVVDGGSSDGTVELLRRFDETPTFRWVSEPDTGVYSAVNKGLRLAQGEILAYLNTDDRYFDYSVESAVASLLRNPDDVFVYGDLLRFHLKESWGELIFYPPFSSRYVQRAHLISQPTVFFRRRLLTEVGFFDESYRLAADIDYWARTAQVASGRKVDEVLAFETWHESRLTSGAEATRVAHAELGRIRSHHAPKGSASTRSLRIVDSVRASLWDRLYRLHFLVRLRAGRGEGWRGFRSTAFRVDVKRFLLSLVPVLGRRARLCVTVDGTLPWRELEELG